MVGYRNRMGRMGSALAVVAIGLASCSGSSYDTRVLNEIKKYEGVTMISYNQGREILAFPDSVAAARRGAIQIVPDTTGVTYFTYRKKK